MVKWRTEPSTPRNTQCTIHAETFTSPAWLTKRGRVWKMASFCFVLAVAVQIIAVWLKHINEFQHCEHCVPCVYIRFAWAKKEPTQRDSHLENVSKKKIIIMFWLFHEKSLNHKFSRLDWNVLAVSVRARLPPRHVSFMARIKIDAAPSALRLPRFSRNTSAALHFEKPSPTV